MKMSKSNLFSQQQGFTLVEVLVALVVAAVALAALSRALGLSVANQSAMESKLVATWVAQDALLQKQLFASQALPEKQTQMGREWLLKVERLPTLVPNFQQVQVIVKDATLSAQGSADKDSVAASLSSIIAANSNGS